MKVNKTIKFLSKNRHNFEIPLETITDKVNKKALIQAIILLDILSKANNDFTNQIKERYT